jgi:hypothetical protein
MSQESSSPPLVLALPFGWTGLARIDRKTGIHFCGIRAAGADVGGTLCREIRPRKASRPSGSRFEEIRTKCGLPRTKCVRFSDLFESKLYRIVMAGLDQAIHVLV